jgi:hypothetical protein
MPGLPFARAGMHSGEAAWCEAGHIIKESHWAGTTLSIAAQAAAHARGGELLITSGTGRALAGSGIQLAKGVEVIFGDHVRDNRQKLYAVMSLEPQSGAPSRPRRPVAPEDRIPDPPEPDTTDLLYDIGEITLFFAPRNVVAEIRATRNALASCHSWRELRASISDSRWREICDFLFASSEPPDDEELDVSEMNVEVEWPYLLYSDMAEWIPERVIDEVGDEYSTMVDSGVNFDPCNQHEILDALARGGIRFTYDDALGDLFATGSY